MSIELPPYTEQKGIVSCGHRAECCAGVHSGHVTGARRYGSKRRNFCIAPPRDREGGALSPSCHMSQDNQAVSSAPVTRTMKKALMNIGNGEALPPLDEIKNLIVTIG